MQIRMNLPNSINWKSGVPAKVADSNTFSESIFSFGVERTPLADGKQVEKAIKSLTEEQKQILRDKYDIHNMEPYSPNHEALMKELRDMGAISDDDYIDSANPKIMVDFGGADYSVKRTEDLPPWDMENVGNDMYKYYFHGQDGFMDSYSRIITGDWKTSFDEMMKIADTQLTQSRAFGRIADVLKDIFM